MTDWLDLDPSLGRPPPPPDPELSADRRRTMRNNAALAAGRHPGTGAALADNGETCGSSCGHMVVSRHNLRNYFKCGLVQITFGPGTDIRKGWPACVRWVEKKSD